MKYYISFFCICTGLNVLAQTMALPDPESLIANLYRQQQTDNLSYADFYESLYQFYLQRLDLNSASVEEFQSLYLLSDKQIQDLEAHIRQYGKLLSVYELQSIESFDVETIRKLFPFVTVRTDENTWRSLQTALKKPDAHYLIFRQARDMEKSDGYERRPDGTVPYLGDPNSLYVRYRFQKFRKLSIGITAEKDPGERLSWSPSSRTYGADYVSFHAMAYQIGIVKRLVLGDYQVQFGQGLVLSGGFFLGKGAETILSVRRNSTGIRPYTSLLETNYLRGAAITLGVKQWEFTPFVSHKYIDGTIQNTDTLWDEDLAVLRYTGLHRTTSELASRLNVEETLFGANTQYNSTNKRLQIGANVMQIQYDKSIQASARVYNLYEFKGTTNSNGSLYYSYLWRNVSVFGELAMSSGGGVGGIQGMMVSLGKKLDVSMVYRNYSPDLHTPYGNAFGENYKNANERGIYWGIKMRFSTKTEMTAYYDTYYFPWLKYKVSAPSEGHEYMLNLTHKFNKKTVATVQYRHESKEKDTYIETTEPYLSFHTRENIMVQLENKADKHWYLRSRVQASRYRQVDSLTQGFLVEQDLGYDGKKVDISLRAALFDTDDFNNRQYTYEKDVLYSFSFPFFSGQGLRNYVLVRFNITKSLTLWLKYGRTTYFDQQTVGNGYDETQGNIRSEWKWQCRYNFK